MAPLSTTPPAPDAPAHALCEWVHDCWRTALMDPATGGTRLSTEPETAQAFAPVLAWWRSAPLAHQLVMLRDRTLPVTPTEQFLALADPAVFEDPWVRRRALVHHWETTVSHAGFDLSRWAGEVVASSGLLSTVAFAFRPTPAMFATVRRALDALPRGTLPMAALSTDSIDHLQTLPPEPPAPPIFPAVESDGTIADAALAVAVARAAETATIRFCEFIDGVSTIAAWHRAAPELIETLLRLPTVPSFGYRIRYSLETFLSKARGLQWEVGEALEPLAPQLFPTPEAAQMSVGTLGSLHPHLVTALATTRWVRHQPEIARHLLRAKGTAYLRLPHCARSRAEFVTMWTITCNAIPEYAARLALEDGAVPGVLPWLVAEDLTPLLDSSNTEARRFALRALGVVPLASDLSSEASPHEHSATPADDVVRETEELSARRRGQVR